MAQKASGNQYKISSTPKTSGLVIAALHQAIAQRRPTRRCELGSFKASSGFILAEMNL
jgi:hypothetical protein